MRNATGKSTGITCMRKVSPIFAPSSNSPGYCVLRRGETGSWGRRSVPITAAATRALPTLAHPHPRTTPMTMLPANTDRRPPTMVAERKPDNGNGDVQSIMESVLTRGDLSKLSVAERNTYYMEICRSLGLNPLTKPFDYIPLNGKLTLYAKRDCADQ